MARKSNSFKKNTLKGKKNAGSDLEGNELSWDVIQGSVKSQRLKKTLGFFFLLFSVFLTLSFISYLFTWRYDDAMLDGKLFNWALLTDSSLSASNLMGRLGAITAHWFIKQWFGVGSFLFILVLFISGFRLLFGISILPMKRTFAYALFFLVWISVFMGFVIAPGEWLILAGVFGYESTLWLNGLTGKIGTALLLFFSMGSFLIIVFNPNLKTAFDYLGSMFAREPKKVPVENDWLNQEQDIAKEADIAASLEIFSKNVLIDDDASGTDQPTRPDLDDLESEKPDEPSEDRQDTGSESGQEHELEIEIADGKISGSNYQSIDEPFGSAGKDLPDLSHLEAYDPTLDLPRYRLPGTELLDEKGSSSIQINKQELEANKNRIIETLNNYSIQIDRIKATVGPTVTLYEIIPAPGVRISKIKNLENDIALSLSALGIRIIAPIPEIGRAHV